MNKDQLDNATAPRSVVQQQACSAAVPRAVTVVYEVVDVAAWRACMNPLRWEHHGLRAHTVAAYDAIEAVDAAAELLEDIRTDSVNAQDEAAKWLRDFENAMSPRPNVSHKLPPPTA